MSHIIVRRNVLINIVMNKSLNIICCIVGGLIGGIMSFYILSAFEDETHLIVGITCTLAGAVAVFASLSFLGAKKKYPDKNYNSHNVMLIWIVCISVAVSSLFMWARERHDKEHKRQHKQEQVDNIVIEEKAKEYPTGRQQMIDEGWEEVCSISPYFLYRGDDLRLDELYIIFYKNDRYSAIKSSDATSIAPPTKFSVTLGDFNIEHRSFNARISVYGNLKYFNL